jgi:hypothetical protein
MKLPVVSGRDAARAFQRPGPPHRRLSIPDHKELAKGTLRALIREAGLSVQEFAGLL